MPPDTQRVLPHKDVVKVITMAPEMPGGIEFIKMLPLKATSLCPLATPTPHSNRPLKALRWARPISHTFNAMTGLSHRQPGVVGAAFIQPVTTELIADTFHVNKGLFPIFYRIKGDQTVLVTDCTRAGRLLDGEYSLSGQPIYVKGIEYRLADGTIAGQCAAPQ